MVPRRGPNRPGDQKADAANLRSREHRLQRQSNRRHERRRCWQEPSPGHREIERMGRQDPYRSILPERDSAHIRGTAQRAKSKLLERASCKTTARQERWKVCSEPGQSFEGITVRKPSARTVGVLMTRYFLVTLRSPLKQGPLSCPHRTRQSRLEQL